jgi:hypothetical protein
MLSALTRRGLEKGYSAHVTGIAFSLSLSVSRQYAMALDKGFCQLVSPSESGIQYVRVTSIEDLTDNVFIITDAPSSVPLGHSILNLSEKK